MWCRTSQVAVVTLLVLGAGLPAASLTSLDEDASDPTLVGRWSVPFVEPLETGTAEPPTAVSSVVLPDGRVLYWNGLEGADHTLDDPENVFPLVNSRARLLDVHSGTPTWTIPTPETGYPEGASPPVHDLWCSGQVGLYDGTVLIAGGDRYTTTGLLGVVPDRTGNVESVVFDPRTDSFHEAGPMANPRWYPTLVTLPDGDVLVVGGDAAVVEPYSADPSLNQVRALERYDVVRRSWSGVGELPYSLPYYPRLHLMPGGEVVYLGSGLTWGPSGQALDEPTWGLQQSYDTRTGAWEVHGPARYGTRGNAMSVLLRLEAPYDRAKVLIAGGTLGPAPGTGVATTLSEVVTVDAQGIHNESSVHGPLDGLVGDESQLRNQRWFSSAALLPTGEVVAVNGADVDATVAPGAERAVRMAELYDPATNTWRDLASGARDRVYHSSAVLLADGRVLVGGHAPLQMVVDDVMPNLGTNPHRDSTFEIYSPPYLFRGERPVITNVTASDGGTALQIALGGSIRAGEIGEVVLVRLPAITHTVDADMRAASLEFEPVGEGALHAALPRGGDGTVVPPGGYFLFVLRSTPNGPVPSVAHTVLVRPAGGSMVTVSPM